MPWRERVNFKTQMGRQPPGLMAKSAVDRADEIPDAYAITRDYGFAPNPFHGFCTLATCKPDIRKSAKVGDWIMGVGGSSLRSVKRRCILLMKVSEKVSFQDYWDHERFSLKKPVRNGSRVQMLGDNIYHKDGNGDWIQEDSHHSNPDGTPNPVK